MSNILHKNQFLTNTVSPPNQPDFGPPSLIPGRKTLDNTALLGNFYKKHNLRNFMDNSPSDLAPFFAHTPPEALIKAYGSPLYLYSEDILRARCRDFIGLSNHPNFRVNYSAKANTNPALLRIIREEGCLADAMSPGELHLNKLAGYTADQMLYVCNNVSAEEMRTAVDAGLLVSVDSLSQLARYGAVNPGGRVMIRLNPGIGAGHHKKVITAGKETKFGINPEDLPKVRDILAAHSLTLAGINQHIGSLFMEPQGYLDAMDVLLTLATHIRTFAPNLEVIDFGGGFGIPYSKQEGQAPLDLTALAHGVHKRITTFAATGYSGLFYLEPGRYIVAECGLLLGTVHAVKQNAGITYIGTDLGFNTLMRPVLYDAHHDIEVYRAGQCLNDERTPQTVVGNICESGDILARDRQLPPMLEGDIAVVRDAGAYGYVMGSSYNQRLRPAEVLVRTGGQAQVIRQRETFADLERGLVL